MHANSRPPNEVQRQKLGAILHHALMEMRHLAGGGHVQQAADLADAFQSLPQQMWRQGFNLTLFRQAFLEPYARRWNSVFDYLAMLDEVERLA